MTEEINLNDMLPGGETIATDSATAKQLRSYIERIERVEEDRAALGEDLKDLFAAAKGEGFDVPTMKTILRLRKKDRQEIEEQESLLDLYKSALGM